MATYSLREMLEWKRPEGSQAQKDWCKKYLEPLFGMPDDHGNYTHIIYQPIEGGYVLPKIVFTAHHDTVHREGGFQTVLNHGDMLYAPNSDCLGADCTTGCWLILNMIDRGVPGIYVIHAGEEVGCVGSSLLVNDQPDWIKTVKAVISFDRKGTTSIITHQLGHRTCSDAFAKSLSEALGMPNLVPDNTGVYTDSNEYIYDVGECTNLSVGYYAQHTNKESQDVFFAYQLLHALLKADWSKLVFEKEVSERYESMWPTYQPGDYAKRYGRRYGQYDPLDWDHGYTDYYDDRQETLYQKEYLSKNNDNEENLRELVRDFPEEVAAILEDWGVDAEYLYEQLEGLYDIRMEKKYGLRRN